jgi:molybdate transport system substrate-binding protein
MSQERDLPEIPLSRADDLHGLQHMDDADLIVFMAGNQFMVMDELLGEFGKLHPRIKKIFYETLPPGLELRQILAGGATFGGRALTGRPDVYTAVSEEAMKELVRGSLAEDYHVYLHNRLVLMVREGNPKGIGQVGDLARDDVRVSQPGELEDISRYIAAMYEKAGGRALLQRITEEKRAEGTTLPTIVHHRETPLRIRLGTADVGPVWSTEAVNAKREGLAVEAVEVGPELDQHDRVNYFVARLKGPNPENGMRFVEFIRSETAQKIYESFGFAPHLCAPPGSR